MMALLAPKPIFKRFFFENLKKLKMRKNCFKNQENENLENE
jgi:hypothetical protein